MVTLALELSVITPTNTPAPPLDMLPESTEAPGPPWLEDVALTRPASVDRLEYSATPIVVKLTPLGMLAIWMVQLPVAVTGAEYMTVSVLLVPSLLVLSKVKLPSVAVPALFEMSPRAKDLGVSEYFATPITRRLPTVTLDR